MGGGLGILPECCTFLISHAVLQCAGCVQHTVGVILQLLTDHVVSTEQDEVLVFHAEYGDLKHHYPLLMLSPQAGMLRILQHQVLNIFSYQSVDQEKLQILLKIPLSLIKSSLMHFPTSLVEIMTP